MEIIPYINIADTEIWMIYIMPFSPETRKDYELVVELQKKCINNKIFGIGWALNCFPYGTEMTEENVDEYIKQYNAQGWSVSKEAIKGYKAIKKGDYVITRLKNGHYFVGRVLSEGAFYINKPNDPLYGAFSWGGIVENWIEYSNDSELPSEIVGRFSQRLHSTIQRIVPYRQRMLVIAMYERGLPEKEFNIPKVKIGVNNFVRSLSYMELEDLVAFYIMNLHNDENYRLLPSSCKVSQQNYEFRFVAKGKKPITCQVKNQQEINIEHYILENSYKKIYFFSGKWNEEYVAKLNKNYIQYPHIHIISPKELYDALIANNIFENDFYDFEGKSISPYDLPLDGYNIVKRIKSETECTLSEDFACFLAKDGLFYSAEFEALVLSYHVLHNDIDREKSIVSKIYDDLNRFKAKK